MDLIKYLFMNTVESVLKYVKFHENIIKIKLRTKTAKITVIL